MRGTKPPEAAQRRQENRYHVPRCRVAGGVEGARLLNLSRSGMALEVPSRCRFARGESHPFTLSDGLSTVDVTSKVRWTRSTWRSLPQTETDEYFQEAGFAFHQILTPQPEGIWRVLRGTIGNELAILGVMKPPVISAREARLPVRMLEPFDGSVVTSPVITLLARIDSPTVVSSVSFNGVGAEIDGERCSADLRLRRGDNRIVVLVRREDGSYCSYALGTVTLDHVRHDADIERIDWM